jgi:hypothetical protein
MSFEKKSLINNMTATKKAIIASSPASPSVGSKVASKRFSKELSKTGGARLSKISSKNVAKAAVVQSKVSSKGLK